MPPLDHAAVPRSPAVAAVVVEPGQDPAVAVTGYADTAIGRLADAGTVLHACSAAKAVTAVVVLRLAQDGLLDLDDDVHRWVPVPLDPAAGGRGPTLRELLRHAGGVTDPAGSFEPADGAAPPLLDVLAGRLGAHPGPVRVAHAPGSGFRYADGGYCLLERVVEVVTGLPFAAAAHRAVVAPLGLTATAFWAGTDPGAASDPGATADAALREVLHRVAARAAAGHRTDGSRVPGVRRHYPGLAASGLWTTPAELGVLLTDLGRAWAGADDAVLLDARHAAAMLDDAAEPGVGLGVFVLGAARGVCVMTQGWGDGFQCQARVYPQQGGVLAVLTNADPGVDQASSVVGAMLRRLAGARGWAA
ncbi:serine hydrolase domain-containing protein [Cellulomonas sp. NPDC058312]|uniref:serine hydrolase domain-containing protein n=1 Tax=Cellulomonas sp. NPDC058312 TaxID=3346441 RepID=UPI0036EA6B80